MENSVAKISVIMPAYNSDIYIKKTILSVLNQEIDDLELIIINDCSTDNTDKIIKEMVLKNKNIVYLKNKKNLGVGATRNKGLRKAQGEYVAFVDSDDIWLDDKINKQLSVFEKDKSIALVYSDGFIFNNQGITNKFSNLSRMHRGYIFKNLLWKNFIPTSSVIIRKNIIKEVGGFSQDLKLQSIEDYDLWLRVARKYKIDFCSEPLIKYRLSNGSLSSNKLKVYRKLKKLYCNWFKKNISWTNKLLIIASYLRNQAKIIYLLFIQQVK